jgi:hypothetical protein
MQVVYGLAIAVVATLLVAGSPASAQDAEVEKALEKYRPVRPKEFP